MDNHYTIRGVIRYYGWLPATITRDGKFFTGSLDTRRNADVSLWTVAPHVRLANLPTYDGEKPDMTVRNDLKIDVSSVESFLKRYGPLHSEDFQLGTTFKVQMPDRSQKGPKVIRSQPLKAGGQFEERIAAFSGAQYLLREAWAGNSEIIAEHFNDGTLAHAFEIVSFEILPRRSGEVVLETEDLWEYMRYLFLTDYAEGRIGVCQRKDCPTPYFIQQRKGQRYCSHDCAVLENVRRFRAKERKK